MGGSLYCLPSTLVPKVHTSVHVQLLLQEPFSCCGNAVRAVLQPGTGKLSLEIPVFPTYLLRRLFQAEGSDVPKAFCHALFWHWSEFGSFSTNFINYIFTQ